MLTNTSLTDKQSIIDLMLLAQEEVNIALMNEFMMIAKGMGDKGKEIIEQLHEENNFNRFLPQRLIGQENHNASGILIDEAREVGITPRLLLWSKKINEEIASRMAYQLAVKLMQEHSTEEEIKILVKGVTDISSKCICPRVLASIRQWEKYRFTVVVEDPYIDPEQFFSDYGLTALKEENINEKFDALVLAVNHREYETYMDNEYLHYRLDEAGVFFDIKGEYPDIYNNEIYLKL